MCNECIHSDLLGGTKVGFQYNVDEPRLPVYDPLQPQNVNRLVFLRRRKL